MPRQSRQLSVHPVGAGSPRARGSPMRSLVGLSTFLVAALVASPALRADTRHPAEDAGKKAHVAVIKETRLVQPNLDLVVGDKVKIVFLERIGSGAGEISSKAMNFVERTELTGNYTLELDGNIYVPILGIQKLVGLGMVEAQAQLQASFRAMFGKEARVSLSIVEREPVYLLGNVAQPGAYEYKPGMTVLHAIARAGGTINTARSEMYDSVRETQRLELSIEKQKRFLARLDVMKAERDGKRPTPCEKLVDLLGQQGADSLIAEIASLRKHAQDARSFRLLSLDSTIEAATRELDNQRQRLEHIKENSGTKAERVALLKQLAAHGSGNAYNYLQARSDLSDSKERLNEVQSLIAQIEDRLAQAQNDKARLNAETRIELEREISEVEIMLAEERMAAAASAQILQLAREASIDRPQRMEDMQFVIIRRTPNGSEEFPADETQMLNAGDLVKVQAHRRGTALAPASQRAN